MINLIGGLVGLLSSLGGSGGLLSSLLRPISLLQAACLSQVVGVLALGLLCALVLCVARLLARHAWFCHRLSCFSTPPTHSWLLGHLGQMKNTEEGLQEVDALVETHRHSCSWFLGPFYHMVRVFHPDFTKPLLMASASITVKDELFYGFLRPWLGQSLLLSIGEEWSRRRRLLTPAFHFDVLKNYTTVFNTSTNILHAKWRRLLAEGSDNMEMFHHISLMTLDSLLKCAFSYNSNCQESSCEYVSAIEELGELIIARRQMILHHWDWIYWRSEQGQRFRKAADVVHGFTRGIVQQRRAIINHRRETETEDEHATTAHRKKDFIDIVLMAEDDAGVGLTDAEIQAEADTFMFAGHDTTSSAICWTLYNLACHPHYQDRCRQEVTELLSGRQEQEIQWDDLSSLPFTTMCIRESLRLHSPVSAVTRQYSQDMNVPGDRTIPHGTIVLVSIYGTHHNPIIWTNPKEFDPLRFDPANSRGRNPHAFIPFSTGPRNCIGQKFAIAELRVVVALTLLRFRVTPGVNPADPPGEAATGGGGGGATRRLTHLVLRAEGGLWLRLDSVSAAGQDDE